MPKWQQTSTNPSRSTKGKANPEAHKPASILHLEPRLLMSGRPVQGADLDNTPRAPLAVTAAAAASPYTVQLIDWPGARKVGDGNNLRIRVVNDRPGDDLVIKAWSQDEAETVGSFTHVIGRGDAKVVRANKLDTLGPGKYQLQVIVRRDKVRTEVIRHTIDIQPSTNANRFRVNTANLPSVYRQGVDTGLRLGVSGATGKNEILVIAWNLDRGEKISSFTHTLDPDLPILGKRRLNELPEANIELRIIPKAGDNRLALHRHQMRVVDGGQTASPKGEFTVSFRDNVNQTFRRGNVGDLRLNVSGAKTGYNLLVQAYDLDANERVQSFTHTLRGTPWAIHGDRMSDLSNGNYELRVTARDGRETLFRLRENFKVAKNGVSTGNGSGNNSGGSDNTTPPPNTGGNDGGSAPDLPDTPPIIAAVGEEFLGINMALSNYWSSQWTFSDIFLQAKEFNENNQSFLFWDSPEAMPEGEFTVQWKGSGEVRAARTNKGLKITKTGDVSDIHIWMPGTAPGQKDHGRFHPLFLERLKPFKTLRFMDWMNTNGATQRPNFDNTGYGKVSVKDMIALSNELGADPWFTMGHLWSDADVRKFAEMTKQSLHKNAKVYIEWSNEVWNPGITKVYKWVDDQSPPDQFHNTWAREVDRVFKIWRSVFKGQEDRIVRVLAGQGNNPWHLQRLTSILPRGSYDVISTAAYFSPYRREAQLQDLDDKGQLTIDKLLDLTRQDILNHHTDKYERIGKIARQYNVPYIAYEAGQHILPKRYSYADTVIESQSDPRMYELYQLNMAAFERAGGSLFAHYSSVRPSNWSGAWGLLEHQNQDLRNAPKYRAVIDYVDSD